MSSFARVLFSSFIKEMRVWRRNPPKLMLVVLLPIMFWIGFNVMMGGVYSTGIEAALVVEEDSPGYYTNGLIGVLGEPDPIPPSLQLFRMDTDQANTMFENGDIQLVITIPQGFEQALENNEATFIHIQVGNLHEDMTKNLRMPVIRKLDIFYQTYLENDSIVDFDYETLRIYTYPRLAYMSWTIAIYSIMFSAMYIAGSSMTQEFEQNTFAEIEMSNQSPTSIYTGKLLSGLTLSYLAAPVLLLLSWLLNGTWPNGEFLIFLALTIPLALLSACLGIIFGTVFRNSVYLVPIAAFASMFYWIIAGGIAPVSMVGISFDIIDSYSPFSNVYRSLVLMFIESAYTYLLMDLGVILSFAFVFMVVSPRIADRLSKIDFASIIQRRREMRKSEAKSQ